MSEIIAFVQVEVGIGLTTTFVNPNQHGNSNVELDPIKLIHFFADVIPFPLFLILVCHFGFYIFLVAAP